MKIDAILRAFNIKSVEEIEKLSSYFVSTDDSGQEQVIDPNMVNKALKKFMEDQAALTSGDAGNLLSKGKPASLLSWITYWVRPWKPRWKYDYLSEWRK